MNASRALFVTTATTEPADNVRAWRRYIGEAEHVTFDINGPNNDIAILAAARAFKPEVIFYTGGVSGDGLPTEATLRNLRKIAYSIMNQGDMADPPFHPVLDRYRRQECFDLYVGMDGVKSAPVDHVTLTPIDLEPFSRPPRERNIHCGFAGNVVGRARWELIRQMHNTEDPRAAVLHRLGNLVQLRERETEGSYQNYASFFRRCRMIINTSLAGSGLVHHVKGRVLESAFAGCALLEMSGSPIADWFPADTYFTYGSVEEAARVIRGTDPAEIDRMAAAFKDHALERYTPRKIFEGILKAAK